MNLNELYDKNYEYDSEKIYILDGENILSEVWEEDFDGLYKYLYNEFIDVHGINDWDEFYDKLLDIEVATYSIVNEKQFNKFAEKYNLNLNGNSPYEFIDPDDECLLIIFNIEDIKKALGYDDGDYEEDLDGWYGINLDTGNEYYTGTQYVLIEVIERKIIVETFDSLRQAQINMRKRVRECADLSDMEKGYDYEISDMSAWITDGNNHDNYDWLIEAV